jgi:DNA (cytosine-5)-methyltransferase 1
MSSSSYIGVDLFAGAGGLSYGLRQAGFDMKLGIEVDQNAAHTFQKNNKTMNVVVSDIRSLDPLEVIKSAGLKKGDIDLVAGGPPCQGFSQSNKRSRCLTNPLNNLYKEFFRFVKKLEPEVFLLENVAGLKTLQKGVVLKDILKISRELLSYHAQWDTFDAVDAGIPQRRKRLFFVGTKHEPNGILKVRNSKIVTVREALDDLPVLENGNRNNELTYSRNSKLSTYQKRLREKSRNTVSNNIVARNCDLVLERYRYISPGGNWKNIPPQLMTNYKNPNNCHGWIYYRLKWDEPSVVIGNFRKNMLIHPDQDRGLSVREAARLQSFSDSYVFYGTSESQRQQVANAVPPLMAKQIGNNIIKYLVVKGK